MEKKTLGSFLCVLRKAKGMTQKELAELLNVSDKAVSRWERDESMPDILLIPVLADIFDAKLIAPSDAQGATSVAAALIAGVGIGAYPGFEAYQNFIQYDKAYTPDASNTAAYGKYKKIFDDSYHALYHVFDSLYDLR